jgi:polyketide cyclase/dehydrase/lipid transport protein
MRLIPLATFLAGIALPLFATEPVQNADWKLVKQANGVAIQSRPHPGSNLKEFKATGEIDAPTKTVHNVIDDVDSYPSFMPYTAEATVLERDHDSLITYQRLSPKIVADRDYTLRIEKRSWPAQFGIAYLNEWKPANEHGPAEKPGVFRVKLCHGSWLLEPSAANKTRATYYVFSDSGINVPIFLANTISETGITKLFAAVRKQAKEPKYQTK